MSELTTERELVNGIKSGLASSVSSSIGATFYTQWQEVAAMPCVVVSSGGGAEEERDTGIFRHTINVTVLSEPSATGNPEDDHFTLADDVLDYLYQETRVSAWNSASNESVLAEFRVSRTESSVDKGRIFRTDIGLDILAKPENF